MSERQAFFQLQSLIFDHRTDIPEGLYLQLSNVLKDNFQKEIYAPKYIFQYVLRTEVIITQNDQDCNNTRKSSGSYLSGLRDTPPLTVVEFTNTYFRCATQRSTFKQLLMLTMLDDTHRFASAYEVLHDRAQMNNVLGNEDQYIEVNTDMFVLQIARVDT